MQTPFPEQQECQLPDTTLTYVQSGSGAPVVVIHGSLADHRYWSPQIVGLAGQFTVYAPSLRYYWPRQNEGAGEFSVEQHASDIEGFITHLIGGPVHLVGHSRGGTVALQLARQSPALVQSLTLADPAVSFAEDLSVVLPGNRESERRRALEQAVQLIAQDRIDEGLEVFIDSVSGPGIWKKLNSRRKRMPLDNAQTLPAQAAERPPSFSGDDLASMLMPVLLVNGERSDPVYKLMTNVLLQYLPNANHTEIPSASHGMTAENPQAFNDALTHFINS